MNNPRMITSTQTIGLVLRGTADETGVTGGGICGAEGGEPAPDCVAAGVPHWLQNEPATDAPHFVQKGMRPPLRYSSALRKAKGARPTRHERAGSSRLALDSGLVQKSALPKVPNQRPRAVARETIRRPPPCALFPRRLHTSA